MYVNKYMEKYNKKMEEEMYYFSRSLNEKDKRRYAAIEARKLGHGGISYISKILQLSTKTISAGIAEIEKDVKGLNAKNE